VITAQIGDVLISKIKDGSDILIVLDVSGDRTSIDPLKSLIEFEF